MAAGALALDGIGAADAEQIGTETLAEPVDR